MGLDIFDFVDRELKNRSISRREFAKAIGAPESSLATAFSRKNISFFLKKDYIEKTAEFLRIPIWNLFAAVPTDDITIDKGELVSEDRKLILDSQAVTNLIRYEYMAAVLNVLLKELGFRDFLYAIGDAIEAKQEKDQVSVQSSLYKAHKYIEEVIDDVFYKMESENELFLLGVKTCHAKIHAPQITLGQSGSGQTGDGKPV